MRVEKSITIQHSTHNARREYSLDVLKCIAAFFVVTIHYNHVSGSFGEIYTRMVFSLVDTAVPIFFTITGFFLPTMVEKERVGGHLKKILKMALASSCFYFCFFLTDAYVQGNVLQYLSSHYTLGTIYVWITGQDDPTAYHLWYFYCLLWTLIICAFIYRRFGERALYFLACMALFYSFLHLGFFGCYSTSIPCVAAGCLLRRLNDYPLLKMIAPPIAIITAGLLLTESYLQVHFGMHNVVRIMCAASLVAIAIGSVKKNKPSVMATIGLKYSAYIYIFHVFINNILKLVIEYDTIILQVVRPLIVFAASLAFAIAYCQLKKKLIHS